MLAVEESCYIRKLVQGGCAVFLLLLVFICGHTNDIVVCEAELLHITSKMKLCQMYGSPFQADACLGLYCHVDTANDFAYCLTL
jgi:hypothetical protein